ncbi:MAG: hypothetical protein ABI321_08965 [Polyangia bacterium]
MKTLIILCLATVGVCPAAFGGENAVKLNGLKFKSGGFVFGSKTVVKLSGPDRRQAVERLRSVNVNPGQDNRGDTIRVFNRAGVSRVVFHTSVIPQREAGLTPILKALYPTETPEQRMSHLPANRVYKNTGWSSLVKYGD